MSAEPLDDVGLAVAVDIALQAVGRRVGQHDPGQDIEVGEVAAGDRHLGVQVAEVERPGDRPVSRDARDAGVDVEVEGIGPVAMDIDQGTAGDRGGDRLPVQRALADQVESRGAGCAGALGGVHRPGQHQAALLVDDVDMAAAQDEMLDRRQGRRLAAALAQGPVVAAGLVGIEVELRMLDVHQGQVHLAEEQGQQFDPHGAAAEVGGAAVADPLGIADLQPVHGGGGRQAEGVDVQMPEDAHLAAGLRRGVGGDGAAQPVPLEQGEEHGHRHRDGGESGAGGQDPAPAGPVSPGPSRVRAPGAQPVGAMAGERGRASPGAQGHGGGRARGRRLGRLNGHDILRGSR